MEISVTRALAEIKLIKNKISHNLASTPSPVDVFVNGVGSNKAQNKDEFIAEFISSEQQLVDLKNRLVKLRSAIAEINVKKKVTVPYFKLSKREFENKEVTIYEAILLKDEYEKSIENYKSLAKRFDKANDKYQKETDSKTDNVLDAVKQLYGNKASQISKDTIARTKDDIDNAYRIEYVYVFSKEDLARYIAGFEDAITQIDLVLSETNATTTITLED